MELTHLIQQAEATNLTRRELATALGVAPNYLTDAKHGRCGLPDYACFQLAKLLGIDPAIVIAASALVTERNPERRAIFAPFAKMARIAGIATIALLGLSVQPSESIAKTSFTTQASMQCWHYVKTDGVPRFGPRRPA